MVRTLLVLALFGLCGADPDIQCDPSQHLVAQCRDPCPTEQTCQNRNGPEPPCVPPMGPCTVQCVCADGYAKNKFGGYCVTFVQCDKCLGNNQYFACDGPYSLKCTGSCHCTDGYARDANGTCVSTTPPPVDNHPPPPPPITPSPPVTAPTECPPEPVLSCDNATRHEIAVCMYGCPPERTCQNRNWPPLPCARPDFPCTPKCICDNGYARNQPENGVCITFEQCDQCPGENEYFQCDGENEDNCIGACYCYSGYVRNINGKCTYVDPASRPLDPPVPITPRPKLKCDNTTRHEVLACRFGCPPERSCQNRHWPPPSCAPPAPWLKCTNKCICDNGYVRNEPSGVCVTEEQCDKCPGENEYFQCDGENKPDCDGHCYCLPNHVRDMDGKCLYVDPASPPKILDPPPATTTENPQCPKLTCDNATRHEIPACVHGCPPERSCQNRFWPPLPCAPPGPEIMCTDKCICDDGYVRNEPSGVCVTEKQCDKCPGENEYFQCDGENKPDCDGHCYCLSNHVRDMNGKCVYVDPASPPKVDPPLATTTEKPPCPKPVSCDNATRHEVPSCVYVCPREGTCQSRNGPHTTCPPPSLVHCTEKCVCDAGYIRNKPNGQCITPEQCDLCSGDNEYFECNGEYAEDCDGHCHCLSGYMRDKDSKCVYVDPASPPKLLDPPKAEPRTTLQSCEPRGPRLSLPLSPRTDMPKLRRPPTPLSAIRPPRL